MESEATIKDWVQRHRVTWEVGGWQELAEHQVMTVGFELRLFGQHEPHVHASAGCGDCVPLFERLRTIALASFPKEHRPTKYEVDPFDESVFLDIIQSARAALTPGRRPILSVLSQPAVSGRKCSR